MGRVVKRPEDRKMEIMNIAADFFSTIGYEETSVNMIVEKAGVAKGTFYHYFDSKEDILSAILENYMDRFASVIRKISEDKNLTAFQKLQYIMTGLLSNQQPPESLTVHIEDRKDAKLHAAMEEKFFEKFYPILLSVLIQGKAEGAFDVNYPAELTEILLIGIRGYIHIHMPQFADSEYRLRKLSALEELFNKLLGNSEAQFKFTR